jgi:ATP synthase in type III secretion protein N
MQMNDLARCLDRALLQELTPISVRGRVNEALGILIKASGVAARIGEVCELRSPDGAALLAEVVGFSKQAVLLTPFGSMQGISSATEVIASGRAHHLGVGGALLGRIVDGFGAPIDGRGDIGAAAQLPVYAQPPHPLERVVIKRAFDTGIKLIDALLRIGEGQRMGLFAPAGVGKSTLIGMLARGSASDVNVIALIGERGREVREFIERNLGAAGLAKSVVVVATSDKPAMERAKAAYVATTVAEHFRAQGRRVLLLMDSVTRFARALREIGLASGEPPARRGYPPSIFAALPQLLERAGQSALGSITAFYSVLTEGEDTEDPIAEEVMSLLDGHIVLSRKLAAMNQYPAVDVLASLSRVMPAVTELSQQRAALKLRSLLAKHQEIELLLKLGEYQSGTDALADQAIAKMDAIKAFFAQDAEHFQPSDATLATLAQLSEV